eukprot:303524-Rhodomonas_salina.2
MIQACWLKSRVCSSHIRPSTPSRRPAATAAINNYPNGGKIIRGCQHCLPSYGPAAREQKKHTRARRGGAASTLRGGDRHLPLSSAPRNEAQRHRASHLLPSLTLKRKFLTLWSRVLRFPKALPQVPSKKLRQVAQCPECGTTDAVTFTLSPTFKSAMGGPFLRSSKSQIAGFELIRHLALAILLSFVSSLTVSCDLSY